MRGALCLIMFLTSLSSLSADYIFEAMFLVAKVHNNAENIQNRSGNHYCEHASEKEIEFPVGRGKSFELAKTNFFNRCILYTCEQLAKQASEYTKTLLEDPSPIREYLNFEQKSQKHIERKLQEISEGGIPEIRNLCTIDPKYDFYVVSNCLIAPMGCDVIEEPLRP